ncbi:hypothetical protein [Streptomyces sp. NPDC086787]|uniref:hypothetical protein n=1 Tax=Streptomyces sp. NPDC086787 TaxID=3365759 RepID=UPI003818BF80
MPFRRKPKSTLRVLAAVSAGAALSMAIAVPAHAVPIIINVPCTGAGGGTAGLNTAVTTLNGNAGGGTIILASYCVYQYAADSGDGQNAVPPITNTITITGNHATLQRTGAASYRLLAVTSGGALIADTFTVMNGSTASDGGGILVDTGGTLTGTGLAMQGNTAINGGGLAVAAGGTADLTGGLINDNRATARGGGIQTRGTTTLHAAVVSGNRSASSGGGIDITAPGSLTTDLTGSRTVIRNNTSPQGGGVKTTSGTGAWSLTLQNANVFDNTANNGEGGGIAMRGPAGIALIKDSTIAGNKASDPTGQAFGGGVSVDFDSTSTSNTATLDNTLVTSNMTLGVGSLGGGIGHFDGVLRLQNGTVVSKNLVSGQYGVGGGIATSTGSAGESLTVDGSSITDNKVTGTGSAAAGLYASGSPTVALNNATITGNTAPPAPAPGGVYSDTNITPTGTTTITGNTPTNCLYSPATITGCLN